MPLSQISYNACGPWPQPPSFGYLVQATVGDPKVNLLMMAADTRFTTKWVPQAIEPNRDN